MKQAFKGILFAAAPLLTAAFLLSCGALEGSGGKDKLPAPEGLLVTPGNGQNQVQWDMVSGAASYNLYWDTESGVSAGRENLRVSNKITDISSGSYLHAGLTNQTYYYYKVAAVSSGGTEGNLSSEASGAPDSKTSACSAGQTKCSGSCVNLSSNSLNCGACGLACPSGQICNAGTCAPPATSCPSGYLNCTGVCVNPQTDASNCGSCGKACESGQACAAGVCGAASAACSPGQTACSGTCVNLQTSPANCGSCRTACPAGQVCTAGVCGASAVTCSAGLTDCAGVCVNFQTDEGNCGACGAACAQGKACVSGVCTGLDSPTYPGTARALVPNTALVPTVCL